MRPVTQQDLAKRHGLFLDFLLRSGRFDAKAGAGAQVTPDNVDAYVTELKSRVGSVTVYGSVQKLRRIVQLMAPDRALDWLIAVERELASEMRPRPKWDRVVYADILVDAGLTLMSEAEIAKRPKLTRARMFRNGLVMALLAYCPVRLKNYAALELGRSFVNVDGIWWILLTAAGTKEKRPDERPAPDELAPFIERYLDTYRPILARGNTETNALWLAMDGKPMSYASMGELIAETSEMTVGVRVNPHLFRTAGVTTLAVRAGNKPHAGGALLHHRPGPVTQQNYNRASSISAGRSLAAVNQIYRWK
jgi:integrase